WLCLAEGRMRLPAPVLTRLPEPTTIPWTVVVWPLPNTQNAPPLGVSVTPRFAFRRRRLCSQLRPIDGRHQHGRATCLEQQYPWHWYSEVHTGRKCLDVR